MYNRRQIPLAWVPIVAALFLSISGHALWDPDPPRHPLAFPGLGMPWDGWSTGALTFDVAGEDDTIRASAYQTDGKLVAVGRSWNGTFNDYTIARFHPDGSLDTSFDTDGIASVPFAGGDAIAHGVAVDAANRIVIAGRGWGFSDWDFSVARLNSDGALDTGFVGGNGHRTIDFGGNDFGRAVAVDGSNRIIIAGYSDANGNFDVALARLTTDGNLDPAFSTDGLVTTSIGAAWDLADAMVLDTAGRIVVAGSSDNGTNYDFAVLRYLTNGSLDNSFSGDGMDTWAIGAGDDNVWAVTIDSTNRVYAAGRADVGGSYRMAFATYLNDGTQNESRTFSVGTASIARGIALDELNRVLLGGRAFNGTNWDFSAIRLIDSEGLDSNFSGDGVVTATVSSGDDFAYGMAIQTDGKIVLVGQVDTGTVDDFGIVRFTTAGALDAAFSGDGRQTASFAAASDIAYDVAIQPNGRIVVVGFSDAGTHQNFAAARFLTNGTLDNTFSGDGLQTSTVGSAHDVANAVVIQANGRIVLAGKAYNGANDDFGFVRYLTNGNLDNTFSGDGRQIITVGTGDDQAHAVAVQADQKILAAGWTQNGGARNFAVIRLLTNGNLDNTFDGDGRVTTAFTGVDDATATGMSLQSDGKIVVGGYAHGSAGKEFALARYLTSGALDPTFSGDGLVTTPIHSYGATLHDVMVLDNGKIAAVGRTHEIAGRVVVARYLSSGVLDSTFDGDGLFIRSVGVGDDSAYAVAQYPDGRVAVGGAARSSSNFDFMAMVFGGSLAEDSDFDGDGIVVTPVGAGDDVALSLASGKGKLILSGYSDGGGDLDLALVRYNENGALAPGGTPDLGFNGNGRAASPVGAGDDIAYAVAPGPGGTVYAAGLSDNGTNRDVALLRYSLWGALDTTFGGGDGIVTTAVGAGNDIGNAIAVQGDGKAVVVGQTYNGSNNDFFLLRYLTNGNLDNTFSGDGIQTAAVGGEEDAAHAVALMSDNRIVVAGYSVAAGNQRFAVARYLTSGSPDTAFDGDGFVTTSFTASGDDTAYAVVVQSDGKIIAGGISHRVAGKDFAFARYLTSGALDATFGSGGLVTVSVGSNGGELLAMDLLPDGRIVAAGRAYGRAERIAVVRLLTNGSPDTTFSGDGVVTAAPGTRDAMAFGVRATGNARVTVAGFAFSGTDQDALFARFNANGSLDTSFSGDGYYTADVGGEDDALFGLSLTADGRLIGAGTSFNGSNHDFLVLRLWQ